MFNKRVAGKRLPALNILLKILLSLRKIRLWSRRNLITSLTVQNLTPLMALVLILRTVLSDPTFSMLSCLQKSMKLSGNWDKGQMELCIDASKRRQEKNMRPRLSCSRTNMYLNYDITSC